MVRLFCGLLFFGVNASRVSLFVSSYSLLHCVRRVFVSMKGKGRSRGGLRKVYCKGNDGTSYFGLHILSK